MLVFSLGWLSALPTYAGTAAVIQPVGATGTHTIIGNDIFLPSGPQRVGLEVRIAGWGLEHLKVVQMAIDSSGFANGSAPLTHSVVSCPSNNSAGNTFCAQTLEAGSRCNIGCSSGSTIGCSCESGFINRQRSDYAALSVDHIPAVDNAGQDYRMGFAVFPPEYVEDPGASAYVGTMFLDVPAGAQGTYTVGFKADETFLSNENNPPLNDIPIALRTPVRIIIGDPVAPGSRYIAYEPGRPGEQTAIQVSLSSIYHPGPPVAAGEDRNFSALQGFVRWAGPPNTFPDTAPGSTFTAASLQCTPHYRDWGSLGVVELYGDTVIPSSVYIIRQVPTICEVSPNDPACFGPGQSVHTGQWGDAAAPFARSDQASQPDAVDLAEIIDAFKGVIDATPKALTQLRGATPNPSAAVNFIDVRLAADAVRGMPYPYPVPPACP